LLAVEIKGRIEIKREENNWRKCRTEVTVASKRERQNPAGKVSSEEFFDTLIESLHKIVVVVVVDNLACFRNNQVDIEVSEIVTLIPKFPFSENICATAVSNTRQSEF